MWTDGDKNAVSKTITRSSDVLVVDRCDLRQQSVTFHNTYFTQVLLRCLFGGKDGCGGGRLGAQRVVARLPPLLPMCVPVYHVCI
jgi:hypothetical protein